MLDDLSLGFLESHPEEAARVLESLDLQEVTSFIDELPVASANRIVRHINPQTAARFLEQLPAAKASALSAKLPIHTVSTLFRHMDRTARARIMAGIPQHQAAFLRLTLGYARGLVGAVMDPQVLSFRERDTVEEAFRRVHAAPESVRHHLYIVNDAEQLRGIVDIRDLLFASGRTPLRSLMQPPAAVLSANASIDIVGQHPAWKTHATLPVRNRRDHFVGVLHRPVDPGESLETQTGSRAPEMTDPLLELAGLAWAMLALLLTSITGSGARVEGDRNAG